VTIAVRHQLVQGTPTHREANPVASSCNDEPSQRAQSGGLLVSGLRYVLIPSEKMLLRRGPKAKAQRVHCILVGGYKDARHNKD
jgi:hypothetical protein